jgi:hypothetical protein
MGKDDDRPRAPVRPMLILYGVFLDAGLSVLAYLVLKWLGQDDYVALLGGTLVAGLRLAYVVLRTRRLDAFALFMVAVFGIGLVLSFVTGDPKFLLVKESFGTAATGLLFLGTCLFGRPLMYAASKRFATADAAEVAEWDERWERSEGFRRLFVFVSVVWGVCFLLEAALRIPLVFVLPTAVMATLGSLATPVMIGLLLLWTLWYGPRREARVARAEESEAAQQS